MSFNIYFAGNHANATDDFFMKRQANRLFNQLFERKSIGEKYLRHKLEVPDTKAKLFVDSSAFSAHTLGSEVDIDDYIEYVNANQGMFDCIAELDKIPGEFRKPKTREQLLEAPEISWNNYLYMRDRVIDNDKLLPIFHMGEDFKWLELMLETTFDGKHIPYIGISPANDSVPKYKDRWFEHVFDIIRKSSNPDVKTHAFGMTALEQLERHPFYSADSTSVIMTGAMGNIYSSAGLIDFSRKSGGIHNFEMLDKSVQKEILETIERADEGFTVENMVEHHQWRAIYNIQFILYWAENYVFKGIKIRQRRLF